MTKLKNWFISLWNRLLNKTTIDEKIEDVVDDVKERIDDFKETIEEIRDEVEDVIEEAQDVVSVIKGKVTKSKLRSMTKSQLFDAASRDHGVNLDSKLNKTNLINKVYELYNK